jgi:hypothetical protein
MALFHGQLITKFSRITDEVHFVLPLNVLHAHTPHIDYALLVFRRVEEITFHDGTIVVEKQRPGPAVEICKVLASALVGSYSSDSIAFSAMIRGPDPITSSCVQAKLAEVIKKMQ